MISENSESRKLVKELGDLIFDNLRDAEFEYEFKKFLSWYSDIPEVDKIVPSSVPFDKFMKKVIGEIHPTITKHFNKENKNRVMKVIYTAYHS